jgi:hypothetical protein
LFAIKAPLNRSGWDEHSAGGAGSILNNGSTDREDKGGSMPLLMIKMDSIDGQGLIAPGGDSSARKLGQARTAQFIHGPIFINTVYTLFGRAPFSGK